MTTAQIIIYSILFILDLSLSVDYVNKDRDSDKQAPIFLGTVSRLCLTWMIILGATFSMNKLKSPNPCPQLEKVENVYKIKP